MQTPGGVGPRASYNTQVGCERKAKMSLETLSAFVQRDSAIVPLRWSKRRFGKGLWAAMSAREKHITAMQIGAMRCAMDKIARALAVIIFQYVPAPEPPPPIFIFTYRVYMKGLS